MACKKIDGENKCVHRETTIPFKKINKYIWKDYAKLKSSVFAASGSIDPIRRWVCFAWCDARDSNMNSVCFFAWMLCKHRIIHDSLFFMRSCRVSFTERTAWNSCEGIPLHFNCTIIGLIFSMSRWYVFVAATRYHTKLSEFEHFVIKQPIHCHHVFRVDHIASLLHESRIRHFNLFIVFVCTRRLSVSDLYFCVECREEWGKKNTMKDKWTRMSERRHCMNLISVPVTRWAAAHRSQRIYADTLE